MEYEKEYSFFKNVALRLQIPLREMNQKEIMFLCGADCCEEKIDREDTFKELEHIFQNANQKGIIHLENPLEDISCLYITVPYDSKGKMIVFGPFRKKDFKIAHSLMSEFAHTVWKKPCETQTYSFQVKKRHSLVESVIQFINNDITKDHSLRNIAKTMHVSPGHLSKLFTQEMGMTLTEFVNRKKIAYGRYLLSTTDEKIVVIASMCGMKDNNYFSRLFKRYVGMTPLEYRKTR